MLLWLKADLQLTDPTIWQSFDKSYFEKFNGYVIIYFQFWVTYK